MTLLPSDITTKYYEFRTVFDYQIVQASLNTGSYQYYYDVSKDYFCYSFDSDSMKCGEFSKTASGYWRCGLHFYDATVERKRTYARFPSVQVNPGATITSAYIQLYSTGSYTGTYNVDVHCEDTANGTNPQTSEGIEALVLTPIKVNWTQPAGVPGDWWTSPSLVPIIQGIVNKPDWREFNAITFVLKNGIYGNWRYWAGQNGAYAPKLHIEVRD